MAASCGPAMSETWLPAQLSRQLVLEGGYQKKAHKLNTKDVDSPRGQQTFVKIDKSSDWLVKAGAGKSPAWVFVWGTSLVENCNVISSPQWRPSRRHLAMPPGQTRQTPCVP